VKIETAIVRGPVAATLVASAVDAAMVCVGSMGIGSRATKFIGATAAAVARSAPCPVAIIRTRDDAAWSASGDIAVVIGDSRDLDFVLQGALEEARLRNATLLALNVTSSRIRELAPQEVDRRLAEWLGRHPEVPSRVLMVPDDIPAFLAERDTPVQLTIIADGPAAQPLVPARQRQLDLRRRDHQPDGQTSPATRVPSHQGHLPVPPSIQPATMEGGDIHVIGPDRHGRAHHADGR